MLFNSLTFIFFHFCILFFYWSFRSQTLRSLLLVFASLTFYGWYYWPGLILFLTMLVINFSFGQIIANKNSKRILTLAIILNLSVLAIFKYSKFIIENIISLFHYFGIHLSEPSFNYWLPLGISFYTFQMIAYLVDVYKKEIPAEKDFLRFTLFKSFYAQLVAGPIVRAKELLPQLKSLKRFDSNLFLLGLYYIIAGLFIKVVIADTVAQFVDFGFENPQKLNFLNSWVTLYGFAVQILADFWGYSTIAVGVGYTYGIILPINFNNPYAAASIGEFWRKWHVTLSSWLRDYLYFPLGGGRNKRYRNLFITLTLTGLWHGANWTFIIYGACHGIWIMLERYFRDYSFKNYIPLLLKQFLVFQGLSILRVLFRATDVNNAYVYFQSLLGSFKSSVKVSDTLLFQMFIFCTFLYFFEKSLRDKSFLKWNLGKQVLVCSIFIMMILSYADSKLDFIYFVF